MHCSLAEDYCRAPKGELTTSCHEYIIRDKVMGVRMPHCELKWEIPTHTFISFILAQNIVVRYMKLI